MLNCSVWFSAPSFWMGGGLENRCVGRVYGADGAMSSFFFYYIQKGFLIKVMYTLLASSTAATLGPS